MNYTRTSTLCGPVGRMKRQTRGPVAYPGNKGFISAKQASIKRAEPDIYWGTEQAAAGGVPALLGYLGARLGKKLDGPRRGKSHSRLFRDIGGYLGIMAGVPLAPLALSPYKGEDVLPVSALKAQHVSLPLLGGTAGMVTGHAVGSYLADLRRYKDPERAKSIGRILGAILGVIATPSRAMRVRPELRP